MQSLAHSPTDALIRLSRRNVWTAFILIALIGTVGVMQLLASTALAGQKLGMLLPVFIAIGVVGLRRAPDAASMAIVLDDELRHTALARAYRTALFAVLILQPLLAVGLAAAGAVNAIPVLAATTVLAGMLVFVGSFLYFDR